MEMTFIMILYGEANDVYDFQQMAALRQWRSQQNSTFKYKGEGEK